MIVICKFRKDVYVYISEFGISVDESGVFILDITNWFSVS